MRPSRARCALSIAGPCALLRIDGAGDVCAGTPCASGDQSPRAGQAGSGVGAGISCQNRIYHGVVEERRAAAAVARLVDATSGGEPPAGVIAGSAALAADGAAATVFADDPAVPLA